MHYVEITLAEARERCNANTKVLVATQDLKEDINTDISFFPKGRHEYDKIFKDVKIATLLTDDFVKRLDLFTEKQGVHRIVLLRE